MYQRHELFANLSSEDISASLDACALPQKDEYTEDEVYRFKECRSLIAEGKTYKQATAHFRRTNKSKQTTGEIEPEVEAELLDLSELLARASKQYNSRIPLNEVVQILDSCGLPDQDEYTSLEGDRFLEACELIKKQNKSYEEVALHFGVVSSTSKSEPNDLQQHLVEQIGGSAIAMDEDLLRLVNKITAKQASGTNIRELVRQAYLINLSRQMTDNQDGTDTFFAEVEERVMAQIEGKNRARSLKANWEWAQNSLTTSSPKQMTLPEDLDNGTSGD